MIIAIDPGPVKSALVTMTYDGRNVVSANIMSNFEVLSWMVCSIPVLVDYPVLVIEKIANMGMPVGDEVFETCYWTGRFDQRFYDLTAPGSTFRIPRTRIKMNLCGSTRANDANVRQALIDRYGGSAAIHKYRKSTKTEPERPAGPLAGISSHCWSALAVGCTYIDLKKAGEL